MATTLNGPLDRALAPRRARVLPVLLMVLGLVGTLAAAAYGYLEQLRTERVVIAVRPLRFGQQITAADLATIEVPLHRPVQLAGMTAPEAIVGRYAAGDIWPNDLLQPTMLLEHPLAQPVFASGEVLGHNLVVLPFSTATVGPLTSRDRLNLGFLDSSGDRTRCRSLLPAADEPTSAPASAAGQPYSCRLLTGLNVLEVDTATKIAYLEATPEQASAVWAIQAAGLPLWGERYGAGSAPLPAPTRHDLAGLPPRLPPAVPGQPIVEQAPSAATMPEAAP